MSKIYKNLSDIKNMYLIKKSGYFDEEYYKLEYPEVKGNLLRHYYYCGYKMGYNPSSKFNNNYYLKTNPDVSSAMINPLLHYLLCGKNEGRRIALDKGLSFGEFYENISSRKYCYEVYKTSSKINRVNLFVDGFSQYSFKEMVDFLVVVLKKCKDLKANLRVFYTEIDFELFNNLLVECGKQVELPDISYVLISDNYLLEFGCNEIIFCVDFLVMYALTNTKYLDYPLYYFLSNNVLLGYEEKVLLSFLVKNGLVKCLSLGKLNIKEYTVQVLSDIKININEIASLSFNFEDLFILGVEFVNSYFGNRFWTGNLYYKSRSSQRKFCLDNDVVVNPLRDMRSDLEIRFTSKNTREKDANVIVVCFEETKKNIDYVNILMEDISDKLDFSLVKVNQNVMFDEVFASLFIEGEENV